MKNRLNWRGRLVVCLGGVCLDLIAGLPEALDWPTVSDNPQELAPIAGSSWEFEMFGPNDSVAE